MLYRSFSILSMPISFSYSYRFKQVSHQFSAEQQHGSQAGKLILIYFPVWTHNWFVIGKS